MALKWEWCVHCCFILRISLAKSGDFHTNFVIPDKFQVTFVLFFLKNIGILIGIALNLQSVLGRMGNLTMLILPFHEHRLFFNFFVPSIYFNSILLFSVNKSLVFNLLCKFIFRCF